jgi:hypothetical protein
MIRTQVQFTAQQVKALRRLSASTGRSIADVVREAVDRYLASSQQPDRSELIERAIRVAGKFSAGPRDVSVNHDKYLEEIYADW